MTRRGIARASASGCSRRDRKVFTIYELVEYLLTLTIPRVDTKPLAKRLLHDFGGIGPLLGASADSLRREGLTDPTIAALKIAEATALRLLEAPAPVVELGRARRLSNRRHGPPTDGGGPDPVPQRQEHAARATKARRAIAVADAEQAIRFIRSHSSQYAVATNRVGVIGFSAGAMATVEVALAKDPTVLPDFAIAMYGAALTSEVPAPGAPPLFIGAAQDDPQLPAINSVALFQRWTAAGLPAELHIYEKGGHGFGFRRHDLPVDAWPRSLQRWLGSHGYLPASQKR